MARELSHDDIEIDAQEAERMHEAMDYAQHRATWDRFITILKWSIGILAVLVVLLYIVINP